MTHRPSRRTVLTGAAGWGVWAAAGGCATAPAKPAPAEAPSAPAGEPRVTDVHPVYNTPAFAPAAFWAPEEGWNPFLKHRKPFAELTPLFHVYTGDGTGDLEVEYRGGGAAPVEAGRACLRFRAARKGAIAGLTYKHKGVPNTVGKKHGTSEFEEYILDFSSYKDGGKFHFRYWLAEGKTYKVMAKVDEIRVKGTGRWESVVIAPLGKELFTHHSLLWLEAMDEEPGEIFVDEAYFFKGEPPRPPTQVIAPIG